MNNRSVSVDPAIFLSVQQCFCEALELDPEEVHWESKVLEDLGAESLDLLDVVFRLERTFDIQIPRGDIEASMRQTEDGPGEVDGRLTQAGCNRLQSMMPEVPTDEIRVGMKVSELGTVFRVGTFYRIVVSLLEVTTDHEPDDIRTALDPHAALGRDALPSALGSRKEVGEPIHSSI